MEIKQTLVSILLFFELIILIDYTYSHDIQNTTQASSSSLLDSDTSSNSDMTNNETSNNTNMPDNDSEILNFTLKPIINIYLIPYEKPDIKTSYLGSDYYRYWGKSTGTKFCEYCLFDDIISVLNTNQTRKFVISNIGVFKTWWANHSPHEREYYKNFLREQQIEFVNGGRTIIDEATTYFDQIIDQYALGHRFLKNEFNIYPRVAWIKESYGHSITHGWILNQLRYNAIFADHFPYHERKKKRQDLALEFVWYPTNNSKGILVHISPRNVNELYYTNSQGVDCYDLHCEDNVIYINDLINWLREYVESYSTNKHIILDKRLVSKSIFNIYSEYYNLESLIDINLNQNFNKSRAYLNLITPSEYLDKLIPFSDYSIDSLESSVEMPLTNLELSSGSLELDSSSPSLEVSLPPLQSILSSPIATVETEIATMTKPKLMHQYEQDFLPYVDQSNYSYVGIYSNRPSFKGLVYEMSRYLNSIKKIVAKFFLQDDKYYYIDYPKWYIDQELTHFEEIISDSLNHYYITGITNTHNIDQIYRSIAKSKKDFDSILFSLIRRYVIKAYDEVIEFYHCTIHNIQQKCPSIIQAINEQKSIFVIVFNAGDTGRRYFEISINTEKVAIIDDNDKDMPIDIFCYQEQDCKIIFTDILPGLSFKAYKIIPSTGVNSLIEPIDIIDNMLINHEGKYTLGIASNLLSFYLEICHDNPNNNDVNDPKKRYGRHCIDDTLKIIYKAYKTELTRDEDNKTNKTRSNHYIFNPDNDEPGVYTDIKYGKYRSGKHLKEIEIVRDLLETKIKIYNEDYMKGLEIETYYYPVYAPVDTNVELIVHFESEKVKMENRDISDVEDINFYTDSNGFFMKKRTYVHHEKNDKISQKARNYYPVTSAAYIESNNNRLTILTDRAQGVTSSKKGELEFMINRICLQDDQNKKLDPLYEQGKPMDDGQKIIIGLKLKHFVMISSEKKGFPTYQRHIQNIQDTKSIVSLGISKQKQFKKTNLLTARENYEVLLPPNINFVIRPHLDGEYILRFTNLNENLAISLNLLQKKRKVVILSTLCGNNCMIYADDIDETILTGAWTLRDINRYTISYANMTYIKEEDDRIDPNNGLINWEIYQNITLEPMQIRTFMIISNFKQIQKFQFLSLSLFFCLYSI